MLKQAEMCLSFNNTSQQGVFLVLGYLQLQEFLLVSEQSISSCSVKPLLLSHLQWGYSKLPTSFVLIATMSVSEDLFMLSTLQHLCSVLSHFCIPEATHCICSWFTLLNWAVLYFSLCIFFRRGTPDWTLLPRTLNNCLFYNYFDFFFLHNLPFHI